MGNKTEKLGYVQIMLALQEPLAEEFEVHADSDGGSITFTVN